MSKQKVVVRKFKCRGAGNDCPPFGFEVVQSKHVNGVERNDMLLDGDLERFKSQNVKVIVVR